MGYKKARISQQLLSQCLPNAVREPSDKTFRISFSPIHSPPSRQAHRLTRREAALSVAYVGLPQLALARIVTLIHILHPEGRKNTLSGASLQQQVVIAETIRLYLYACCSFFPRVRYFPKVISTNLDPLTLDPFFPRGQNSKLVAAQPFTSSSHLSIQLLLVAPTPHHCHCFCLNCSERAANRRAISSTVQSSAVSLAASLPKPAVLLFYCSAVLPTLGRASSRHRARRRASNVPGGKKKSSPPSAVQSAARIYWVASKTSQPCYGPFSRLQTSNYRHPPSAFLLQSI